MEHLLYSTIQRSKCRAEIGAMERGKSEFNTINQHDFSNIDKSAANFMRNVKNRSPIEVPQTSDSVFTNFLNSSDETGSNTTSCDMFASGSNSSQFDRGMPRTATMMTTGSNKSSMYMNIGFSNQGDNCSKNDCNEILNGFSSLGIYDASRANYLSKNNSEHMDCSTKGSSSAFSKPQAAFHSPQSFQESAANFSFINHSSQVPTAKNRTAASNNLMKDVEAFGTADSGDKTCQKWFQSSGCMIDKDGAIMINDSETKEREAANFGIISECARSIYEHLKFTDSSSSTDRSAASSFTVDKQLSNSNSSSSCGDNNLEIQGYRMMAKSGANCSSSSAPHIALSISASGSSHLDHRSSCSNLYNASTQSAPPATTIPVTQRNSSLDSQLSRSTGGSTSFNIPGCDWPPRRDDIVVEMRSDKYRCQNYVSGFSSLVYHKKAEESEQSSNRLALDKSLSDSSVYSSQGPQFDSKKRMSITDVLENDLRKDRVIFMN